MQEKLQQRGAVEPVVQLRALHELRGAGTLDGRIDLGGIEVELIRELKIGGPLTAKEGEFEQHDDIERLEHFSIVGSIYSIFK